MLSKYVNLHIRIHFQEWINIQTHLLGANFQNTFVRSEDQHCKAVKFSSSESWWRKSYDLLKTSSLATEVVKLPPPPHSFIRIKCNGNICISFVKIWPNFSSGLEFPGFGKLDDFRTAKGGEGEIFFLPGGWKIFLNTFVNPFVNIVIIPPPSPPPLQKLFQEVVGHWRLTPSLCYGGFFSLAEESFRIQFLIKVGVTHKPSIIGVHFRHCITLLPYLITEPLKLWAEAKDRSCLLRQHPTGDLPHLTQSKRSSVLH